MVIPKGTLWERLTSSTRRALAANALFSFPTGRAFVEEKGVRYFVRVLESLSRKDEARRAQDRASQQGRQANPFLPPEPDLTVGDVGPGHLAVLNKFNVVENHLLLVTRKFEDQDALLTPEDFEALWQCLSEYDSLGFYNGGREAGASQQHKHLQLVPLPLAPEGPVVPMEPMLGQAPAGHGLSRVPAFPFLHSFVRLEPGLASAPGNAARQTFGLYCDMLQELGMRTPSPGRTTRHSAPYCLLVARTWMLLVPRSREHVQDISLNSLAYAGSFFVRSQEQLERLKAYGMMNALKTAGVGLEGEGGPKVEGQQG